MLRRDLESHLLRMAGTFPVVTLTGPRQSGKTTLVRAAFSKLPYVSLEQPDERQYAIEDPRGFLGRFADGVVLDEIQRAPDLTSYIQVLVDEERKPGRFILTGSENLTITARTSQSLAGRTAMLRLLPLTQDELARGPHAKDSLEQRLWRGGYPILHATPSNVREWMGAYVTNYVERDARQLLNIGDLSTFQRFLGLCAGRVGNLLNLSSLGSDAGVSHATAKSWISVLEASYLVFHLTPWFRNPGKRLIKSPKLYFWDTGLVCHLLRIRTPEQLDTHPLRGAIFENWVVAELLKQGWHRGDPLDAWFYRDRSGLEVDLLVQRGMKLLSIEAKSGRTVPSQVFRSQQRVAESLQALDEFHSSELYLVYGGGQHQQRSSGTITPWSDVGTLIPPEE